MNDKIQLLIVEDEALIAHNMKQTLEDFGYEIVGVCHSYEEAMISIKKLEFDVLLLDINLGSLTHHTGLDIAAQLPAIKCVPFIFLTAFSDRETINQATKLNPSAYLVKPLNEFTLFATIQTAFVNFNQNQSATLPDETAPSPDFFYSKIGRKITKVYWNEVVVLEAIKNYVRILTIKDKKEFLVRGSLAQVQKNMLPKSLIDSFVRINRSMFLHKDRIIEFQGTDIITEIGNFNTTKEFIKAYIEQS